MRCSYERSDVVTASVSIKAKWYNPVEAPQLVQLLTTAVYTENYISSRARYMIMTGPVYSHSSLFPVQYLEVSAPVLPKCQVPSAKCQVTNAQPPYHLAPARRS